MAAKPKSIVQREIALKTGLSQATVSRALSNHPKISASTKQRVAESAEELGYRKDPLLSILFARLRSKRDHSIRAALAFITSIPSKELVSGTSHASLFFKGAKQRAWELGYGLDLVDVVGRTSRQVTSVLRARGIMGVVIGPRKSPLGRVPLAFSEFPCVAVGHPLVSPRLHYVMAWPYQLMGLALRSLRRSGYRRVGVAVTSEADAYAEGQLRARYLLHTESIPKSYRIPFFSMPKSGRSPQGVILKWMHAFRPDVVIGTSLQGLGWLQEAGFRVPADVAYVDLHLPTTECGAIAGTCEQPGVVASSAVDLVVEQIQNNASSPPAHPRAVLIEGVWVNGESAPLCGSR